MSRWTIWTWIAGIAAAAALSSAPAGASPKISVATAHYDISGPTGDALVAAMDRQGPRHGFLARAIAQTRYRMRTEAVWVHRDSHCQPAAAEVRLEITYVYPRLKGPTDARMKARWRRFMAGVEAHERTHGRIAMEMAAAVERAIRNMRFADAAECNRSRRALKRKVDAIVERYERRQAAFDRREHRPGGRVEGLVRLLAGG